MNVVQGQQQRLRPICDCSSYRFPHRAGGGACICSWTTTKKRLPDLAAGARWADPIIELDKLCAGCGQPAETKEMDFGIGAYEFWGSREVHRDIQVVTECCETGLVDNSRAVADAHPEWFNNKAT